MDIYKAFEHQLNTHSPQLKRLYILFLVVHIIMVTQFKLEIYYYMECWKINVK